MPRILSSIIRVKQCWSFQFLNTHIPGQYPPTGPVTHKSSFFIGKMGSPGTNQYPSRFLKVWVILKSKGAANNALYILSSQSLSTRSMALIQKYFEILALPFANYVISGKLLNFSELHMSHV